MPLYEQGSKERAAAGTIVPCSAFPLWRTRITQTSNTRLWTSMRVVQTFIDIFFIEMSKSCIALAVLLAAVAVTAEASHHRKALGWEFPWQQKNYTATASPACPPPGFNSVKNFDLARYISAPFFVQKQVSTELVGCLVDSGTLLLINMNQIFCFDLFTTGSDYISTRKSAVLRSCRI